MQNVLWKFLNRVGHYLSTKIKENATFTCEKIMNRHGRENFEPEKLECEPSIVGKLQSSLELLSFEPFTYARGLLIVSHVTLEMGHLAKLVSCGSCAKNCH